MYKKHEVAGLMSVAVYKYKLNIYIWVIPCQVTQASHLTDSDFPDMQ